MDIITSTYVLNRDLQNDTLFTLQKGIDAFWKMFNAAKINIVSRILSVSSLLSKKVKGLLLSFKGLAPQPPHSPLEVI